MKRYTGSILLAVLMLWTSALYAKSKTMSVQVENKELRSGPSFFESEVGKVTYGQRTTVIQEKNGWSKVSIEGSSLTGWIHSSALTKKKIQMKAGDKDTDAGASSGELALARKGFSEEVENQYKKANKSIDFAPVDKMVAINVSKKDIKTFFDNGKVAPAKGGAK